MHCLPRLTCLAIFLLGLWGNSPVVLADLTFSQPAETCFVCRRPFAATVYAWTDKVTGRKERICGSCLELPHNCYVCSIPLLDNYVDLRDTRFICGRDEKSVMLDVAAITTLCEQTQVRLDRQLSRFLSLPDAVEFSVVDRQTIIELSNVPGNDYSCPNVMGYTQVTTNESGAQRFPIAILSGQSRGGTASTCAHELGHVWTIKNVSPARLRQISKEAREGFCELLAYLHMRELGETQEIANIRSNLYTRGQMDLFIAAEERFGLNSVVDWMKQGRHDRLSASEPWGVQELNKAVVAANATGAAGSVRPATFSRASQAAPAALPEQLQLKSVTLGGRTPMALINQSTLALGETGRVQLAHTNLTIRCVAIRADSVTVERVGSGEREELRFATPLTPDRPLKTAR